MNLKAGLVRAYNFDGKAIDFVNGQNGTENSMSYIPVSEYRNLGAKFAGNSSSYIQAPVNNLPLGSQPFTSLVLFKTTSTGLSFYGFGNAASYGYRNNLGIYNTGHLYFTGFGSGDLDSNFVVNDGKVHVGVMTFDGSVGKIYVDGSLKNSASLSLNIQSSSLYIGKSESNDAYYPDTLSKLYFWNRVLNIDEINYITKLLLRKLDPFSKQITKRNLYQALYSTNITVNSTVLSGVLSAQSPTISGGSKTLPNVLSAVFSSQTATQKSAVTIPVNVINTVFSIPTINVITPDARIYPNSQNAVFSIPIPSIIIIYPNVTVSPNIQNLTFSIQTPTTTVSQYTTVLANSLSAVFTINSISIYNEKSETVLSSVVNMSLSVVSPKKTGGLWAQVPRLEGDWTPVPRVS